MKKFLKSLVAVMLVCLMAVSFTACGGVSKDPAKAKANLEKNGYAVVSLHNDGSLVEGTAAAAAITGMVAGYGLKASDIDYVVTGTAEIEGSYESVVIYYCKTKDAATKIHDAIEKQYNDLKAKVDKMEDGSDKDEAKAELKDSKYGKSGTVVWMGTKAGVKAA